jgi:Pilus formation protein N terminal region
MIRHIIFPGDAVADHRFIRCAFLAAWLACPAPVLADDPSLVETTIDEATLIRLGTDVAQLIVGNPAIADVSAQSPRLLVITGKSYGATNLIALDSEGREIFNARLAVHEGDKRQVTLYKGTMRQSLHCAPDCQRMLSIGDDKTQFEQLAETVTRKFGVVNSAIGGQ